MNKMGIKHKVMKALASTELIYIYIYIYDFLEILLFLNS